jgi:hypothetical protein
LCNEAVQLHARGGQQHIEAAVVLYRKALEAWKKQQQQQQQQQSGCNGGSGGCGGFGNPTILFNLGTALQAIGDLDGAVSRKGLDI